jgi:hypothetical protein
MAKRRAGNQIGNLTPLTFDHYKSRIALISLRVGDVPHTIGKLSTRAKTLLKPHLDRSLQKKLWASKVAESQFWEFWNSNLGVPRPNDIWVLAWWLGIENTIRGKVVASPKFGLWWLLWIRGSFVHQKCFNYALTNLLFGLCMFMWVIDLLVTLPSPHLGTLARPSTPKVLRVIWCSTHFCSYSITPCRCSCSKESCQILFS